MDNKELTLAQQKKKELFAQKKNGYDKLAEGELALINEYCQEVFEQDADFSDLSHVDLAMGATSDSEHTIEIHADLTAFRLVYRVDGETVHKVECKDLQELNEYLEYYKKIQTRGKLESVKSGCYIGSISRS